MTSSEFLIRDFINDAGGAAQVARWCGVHRTAPYGWIRQGYMRSSYITTVLGNTPLRIGDYFTASAKRGKKKPVEGTGGRVSQGD